MKESEKIAQWVIHNRYPKSEKEKLTDREMYYAIVKMIEKLCNTQTDKPACVCPEYKAPYLVHDLSLCDKCGKYRYY